MRKKQEDAKTVSKFGHGKYAKNQFLSASWK